MLLVTFQHDDIDGCLSMFCTNAPAHAYADAPVNAPAACSRNSGEQRCQVAEEMVSLPVEGCLWPWLEPVNDSGIDGGQETLTSHTEVGSYRTGCEHHM